MTKFWAVKYSPGGDEIISLDNDKDILSCFAHMVDGSRFVIYSEVLQSPLKVVSPRGKVIVGDRSLVLSGGRSLNFQGDDNVQDVQGCEGVNEEVQGGDKGAQVQGSGDESGEVHGGHESGQVHGGHESGEVHGGHESGEVHGGHESEDVHGGHESGQVHDGDQGYQECDGNVHNGDSGDEGDSVSSSVPSWAEENSKEHGDDIFIDEEVCMQVPGVQEDDNAVGVDNVSGQQENHMNDHVTELWTHKEVQEGEEGEEVEGMWVLVLKGNNYGIDTFDLLYVLCSLCSVCYVIVWPANVVCIVMCSGVCRNLV